MYSLTWHNFTKPLSGLMRPNFRPHRQISDGKVSRTQSPYHHRFCYPQSIAIPSTFYSDAMLNFSEHFKTLHLEYGVTLPVYQQIRHHCTFNTLCTTSTQQYQYAIFTMSLEYLHTVTTLYDHVNFLGYFT